MLWSRTVPPKYLKGHTAVPGKSGWLHPNGELLVAMSIPPTIQRATAASVNIAYVGQSKKVRTGDKLFIYTEFSQPVVVTGSPEIAISVNGVSRNATYLRGSGTAQLIFAYTIVSGDSATAGQVTMTEPAPATHTFGSGNSQIIFTAVANGTTGNSITVALTAGSGDSIATSVTTTVKAVVVTLGTNISGTVNATVAEVIAAVAADSTTAALVVATTSGDGTGTVAAITTTDLAGGSAASSISLNSGTISNSFGVLANHTFGSSNTAITFTAKAGGSSGNSLNVVLVASGDNTPLSVSYATSTLTVNLATNGSAASISTVAQVIAAVNTSYAANSLLAASTTGDGTGVVASASSTALSGGTNTSATLVLSSVDLSAVTAN